ncbi:MULTISPECIES: hypothetical protein [Nocardioides]|uniref:DUF2087 domain-containing protein n=1 Tax=Nocardioides vastitatis TaxID=2568655 RepID=A0ABW0ZFN7_9ACTN|nr:hypothetical protein [Nocardioides sp.]
MSRVPPDEQQVLKRFFSAEGRLLDMPVRHVRRAVVHLVDDGFLAREDDLYWRSDGV